jgi:hypothetical protein
VRAELPKQVVSVAGIFWYIGCQIASKFWRDPAEI